MENGGQAMPHNHQSGHNTRMPAAACLARLAASQQCPNTFKLPQDPPASTTRLVASTKLPCTV